MTKPPPGSSAGARCCAPMRRCVSVSCARTLMKYDDVQQPTQSPQATFMPGPPARAARIARSHSEKFPAGSDMRRMLARRGCARNDGCPAGALQAVVPRRDRVVVPGLELRAAGRDRPELREVAELALEQVEIFRHELRVTAVAHQHAEPGREAEPL